MRLIVVMSGNHPIESTVLLRLVECPHLDAWNVFFVALFLPETLNKELEVYA